MDKTKVSSSTIWMGALLPQILLFAAACGGGGTPTPTPPPPTISVSISSASSIVQANAAVQLHASVKNSPTQDVAWAITQPAGLGSITPGGLYSAPALLDECVDVEISATSVADPTKSASLKITASPAPAIAVRQNAGRGEFYTVRDGLTFVPRGNNYLRFSSGMIRLLDGVAGYGLSTLNSTRYDPARTEQAMAAMETQGYNVVRTFLDISQQGDIGNESGPGLSKQYVANLADFMARGKTHHIYVLPAFSELPMAGGYTDFIAGELEVNFGVHNSQFLTQPGVDACREFWQDLIQGLVMEHAPMDASLAYEITGEFAILNDLPPMDKTSGTIQTVNGSTYDLSDPVARVALQNDNMVFYANAMREAIRSLNPDAIVVMGFFSYNGLNPPPFPAIANSDVDFIDLHGWPDSSGTTIDQLVANWQVNGDLRKPIIMGEYDGFTAVFPTPALASDALKDWQIASCSVGFDGWILWTWDTEPSEQLPGPWSTWSALSGNGEINHALAPLLRPNPCSN